MKLCVGNIELTVHLSRDSSGEMSQPVIFLHGMTLSGREWEPLMEALSPEWSGIAPDLIGHGDSDAPDQPNPYEIDAVVEQLVEMMDTLGIDQADWVGYSMGGRILLHFVLTHPGRVRSMVLESTSPGMEGVGNRKRRRQNDHELARFIEANPLEQFVERWISAPIFESQQQLPQDKREWARDIRRSGNPVGLAWCFRELGRGTIPHLWDRVGQLEIPTMLITGRLDDKHVAIHQQLAEILPAPQQHVMDGVGHNVHFEAPDQFVGLVRSFLREQNPS